MAKTIEQIQAMITDKHDAREVINEIADYIEANPGGGGSTGYLSATVELDNDDIINLPTTPFELIAAPGVGKGVIVQSVIIGISPWFANYGNIAGNARIHFGDPNENAELTSQLKEAVGAGVSNILAWGEASIGQLIANQLSDTASPAGNSGWNRADLDDQPLNIFLYNAANGVLTGGNAGNKLRVNINYNIIDL